jgi:hypothetical protein
MKSNILENNITFQPVIKLHLAKGIRKKVIIKKIKYNEIIQFTNLKISTKRQ